MTLLEQLQEFSLPKQLAVGLQLLAFPGSLWAWSGVIRSWLQGREVLPERGEIGPRVPPIVNLVGFFLGVFVFPSLWVSWWKIDFSETGEVMLAVTAFRLMFVVFWWGFLWDLDRRAGGPSETREYPLGWRCAWNLGLRGFLLAFGPVSILLFAVMNLRKAHPLIELLQSGETRFLWLQVLGAAVIAAPLYEELMFRVTLQSGLSELLGWKSGLWITAILFCLSHGGIDAIPLFPLAVILGYLYHRTRSYLAVVILHGLFNGFNLLLYWLSSCQLG